MMTHDEDDAVEHFDNALVFSERLANMFDAVVIEVYRVLGEVTQLAKEIRHCSVDSQ